MFMRQTVVKALRKISHTLSNGTLMFVTYQQLQKTPRSTIFIILYIAFLFNKTKYVSS